GVAAALSGRAHGSAYDRAADRQREERRCGADRAGERGVGLTSFRLVVLQISWNFPVCLNRRYASTLRTMLGSISGKSLVVNHPTARLSSSLTAASPSNERVQNIRTKYCHWSPLGSVPVFYCGSQPNPNGSTSFSTRPASSAASLITTASTLSPSS